MDYMVHHPSIFVQLGQQQYSYVYLYSQIALAIARAITDRTHTCKSTDYCPNCTLKCCTNEKITRERCAM